MPLLAFSAYEAGLFVGAVTLAVLIVALLLRAFDVLPRKNPTPHGTASDIGVAAILGVLLTISLSTGRADAWDAPEAKQLRSGFIAGCKASAGTAIDCACAFSELTSKPPYDTPAGFAEMQSTMTRAVQNGQAPPVPPEYFEVAARCARGA